MRACRLPEGNRVLESIGRQDGLNACSPSPCCTSRFAAITATAGSLPDRDLFQTESFFLDEVLQLICDRAMALSRANGVVVAMREGSDFVCRAAAGSLPIFARRSSEPGLGVSPECLVSGRTVRCDDRQKPTAASIMTFSATIGARATVLAPVRGLSPASRRAPGFFSVRMVFYR